MCQTLNARKQNNYLHLQEYTKVGQWSQITEYLIAVSYTFCHLHHVPETTPENTKKDILVHMSSPVATFGTETANHISGILCLWKKKKILHIPAHRFLPSQTIPHSLIKAAFSWLPPKLERIRNWTTT